MKKLKRQLAIIQEARRQEYARNAEVITSLQGKISESNSNLDIKYAGPKSQSNGTSAYASLMNAASDEISWMGECVLNLQKSNLNYQREIEVLKNRNKNLKIENDVAIEYLSTCKINGPNDIAERLM